MNRRLARGLDALLNNMSNNTQFQTTVEIPIDQIKPNPYQPRTDFHQQDIHSLAQSIKSCGLLQPIVVRQCNGIYEIVFGERRYRAAKLLGYQKIPCIVNKVDESRMLLFALVENVNRKDLNPVEKAVAFKVLSEKFGLTHEQIGDVVGLDRTSVTNSVRLLELPDEIKDAVSRGTISQGHARALLSLNNRAQQLSLLRRIITEGLSVRTTERIVMRYLKRKPETVLSSDATALEIGQRLTEFLGTKVTVKRKKRGGQIVIEFYSDQQLQDILSKLGLHLF
jgi:ParB family chromosome partitioning protein